jgi:hypothetical protein
MNTQQTRRRRVLVVLPITIVTLVVMGRASVQPTPESSATVTSIEKLKALDLRRATPTTLRQEYVVEGYFVADPMPMLVKDLKFVRINTPMPDSVFILLRGKGIDALRRQEAAPGSVVRARCRIVADGELLKGKLTPVLDCPEPPTIVKRAELPYRPQAVPICKIYPHLCELPPHFISQSYALIYSGGVDSSNAHKRYWNDLKFMYLTLRNKYGFSDANIVVVYKDGKAEDSDMTVDYAASPTGLNDAIKDLRARMTMRDDLFVFVTNHGGGYHDTSCGETSQSWGGRKDVIPEDEIDSNSWDEETYYYNQASNDVWDDDFANGINSLYFRRMVAVFEQCFSGGFLRDLRGCNRVLISAASEFQFSWALGPSYN